MEPIAVEKIVQTVSSVVVNVYPEDGTSAWVAAVIALAGVLVGTLGTFVVGRSLARRRERIEEKREYRDRYNELFPQG